MKSSKTKRGERGPYKRYLTKDGSAQNIPKRTVYNHASSSFQHVKTMPMNEGCSSSRSPPAGLPGVSQQRINMPAVPIANDCQQKASTTSMELEPDLSLHGSNHDVISPPPSHITVSLDYVEPGFPEQDCFIGVDDTNLPDEDQHAITPESDGSFNNEFCQNFNVNDDDGFLSEEESSRLLLADTPPMMCPADESSSDVAMTSESPPIDDDSSDSDEELAIAPQLHLTVQEKIKIMLLLATKRRHNLSYTAAENIMEFSNVMSYDDEETDSAFRPTKHIMKRAIDLYSFALAEHHICPECGQYIGIIIEISFVCSKCSINVITLENRKSGHFFLYLSLQEQLRTLLEKCLTKEELIDPLNRKKINSYNYEDLFDGAHYKKNVEPGLLTLNFFVDGLQIATTCKTAAWPVLVSLNEIPLHLRRQYLMMASVWLSDKKPNCNEYLKPFVEECKKLRTVGVQFKRNGELFTQKFQVGVCISDSVARPLLRNCSQFNGKYGCGLCYHPGIRMPFGRGHIRSYSTCERSYPLRTHEETLEYARRAEVIRKKVKGVKGRSVLSDIPNFDIVNQLDPDSFHCLVNVAKRFTWLWFGDKFRKSAFNISDKLTEVDTRLLSITPTCDISRFPRSLTARSDYRGHEWYHWIMTYSIPCLKNILPAKYLNHWSQLPFALALLMQNSVAKSDVGYADRYLKKFVSEIDTLYGSVHVTFSVHLLTHLAKSVQNFAQPFCHSAFIYEAENADIKNLVKSSNGAIFQISKGVQLNTALKNFEFELRSKMNRSEIAYLTKVTSSLVKPTVHCTVGNAGFLGKPNMCILEAEALVALRRAGVLFDATVPHAVYLRCELDNVVFHSTQYLKAPKQNNYVVSLEDDSIFIINSFIVLSNSDKCFALGYFIMEDKRRKLCDPVPPHLKVLKNNHEGILRCIPVTSIQSKLLSFSCKLSENESVRLAYINVLSMEMLK